MHVVTVTALPLPGPVAALTGVVDALAAERPAELPGPVALERARVLLAEAERLKTVALLALADVDRRDLSELDGAPSTAAWVAGLAVPGLDRREVTLARRLPGSPQVAGALLAGRLGSPAATRVTGAVAKARPHLDRPDGLVDGQPGEAALTAVIVDGVSTLLAEQTGGAPAGGPVQPQLRVELTAIVEGGGAQADRLERALVLLAERSAPRLLPGGLALLLDALLPAEHEARASRAEAEATLDVARDPLGTGWLVRGRLDDVTGEMLATVLAAEEATDPANPEDTAAWRAAGAEPALADLPPSDWPSGQTRPRGRAGRAAGALGRALRRLLDSGAQGSRDRALPHLAVTVPLDYVNGLPGALPARAHRGSHLTRRQLRALACRAMFTRLVLDAGNRVIAASHTQRTATALERLIVHTTWAGRCAVADCPRGPDTGHPLTPHHADLYSRTGQTALADTVPLCDSDHHRLHQHRRALRLRDGRWIGPDGWLHEESA